MKKIVDIRDDTVFIEDDDGSLMKVRREDCFFEPQVGNAVKVFSNSKKIIVTKLATLSGGYVHKNAEANRNAPGKKENLKSAPSGLLSDDDDDDDVKKNAGEAEEDGDIGKLELEVESTEVGEEVPPELRGRLVNKTIYCLLALFLGGLGAHKFYAGKNGLGILYLVLCWTSLPSLISLIEFFITLFTPSDKDGNIRV